MEPANKLRYYEDLYGERYEEEEFDRHPDVCEDESDSDDDQSKSAGTQPGFFARFADPIRTKPSIQPGYTRYVEIKPSQGKFQFNSMFT